MAQNDASPSVDLQALGSPFGLRQNAPSSKALLFDRGPDGMGAKQMSGARNNNMKIVLPEPGEVVTFCGSPKKGEIRSLSSIG